MADVKQVGVNVTNVNVLPDFEYNVVNDYIQKKRIVAIHSDGRIREQFTTTARQAAAPNAAETVSSENLLSNYPNPSDQSTQIDFRLSSPEHVSISVYDIFGKELVTVTDQNYPEGPQSVKVNTSELPNGTYIFKYKDGQTVRTCPLQVFH